jgi:hypothetical protein
MPNVGKRGRGKLRDEDGCDLREGLFARYYIKFKGHGPRSAHAAGYSGDLRRRACALLKRPHVLRAIRRRTETTLASVGLSADEVIVQLARIARFDMRRLYDEQGKMLKMCDVDGDTALAIASVTQFKDKVIVVACDRIQALELLSTWLRHEKRPSVKEPSLLDIHFVSEGIDCGKVQ